MKVLSLTHRMLSIVVLFALALMPVTSVFAQSEGPDDPDWETEPLGFPYGPKPDAPVNLGDDQLKDVEVPLLPEIEEVSPTAIWHTIEYETFEGIWPDTNWASWNYNAGSSTWDDVNRRAYGGSWSAHPSGVTSPYPNNLHSIMRYGPFSLAGATNAKFTFTFWLAGEPAFDWFSWGYSCDGGQTWTDTSKSSSNSWQTKTMQIKSCVGSTSVYVRFMFTSDYSVVNEGVYVDNVRIQSYY